MYDIKTKNISFLKVSKLLRERGVKNNKFLLTLNDPDLVGVDPYSNVLSLEMQLKIYTECCTNKWYFLREVIKLPQDGASVHYEANIGNITLSYVKGKNKNIAIVLPRQHGKTMGEIADDVWSLCFVSVNTNIIYLNKGLNDCIKNLKLFRDIKNLLPTWMLNTFILDRRDKDNEEYKLIAKRNNTLKVVAPANDPDGADKAGRGLTTSNIVFEEFA